MRFALNCEHFWFSGHAYRSWRRILSDYNWSADVLPSEILELVKSDQPVNALKAFSNYLPTANWRIEFTFLHLQKVQRAADHCKVVLSPLLIALALRLDKLAVRILEHIMETTDDVATLPYLVGQEDHVSLAFPLLIALHLGHRDANRGGYSPAKQEQSRKTVTIPLIDLLLTSKHIDPFGPLGFSRLISDWQHMEAVCDPPEPLETLAMDTTGAILGVSDSANSFYVCCQFSALQEVAHHLLTSARVGELRADRQLRKVVYGPSKRTLLMAAAGSAFKTLRYLVDNIDLLIDEPDFEKRPAAIVELLNARDLQGQTVLHHLGRSPVLSQVPLDTIEAMVKLGADPVIYSPSLSGGMMPSVPSAPLPF